MCTHLRSVDEDCKVGAVLHEVGVADVVLGHACAQSECMRRCLKYPSMQKQQQKLS
jgi:hypothetical protein